MEMAFQILTSKNCFNFIKNIKKVATVTAVRPPARFGELSIKKELVKKFDEKNQINSGWINGGFFVFDNKIFNFIPSNNTMLERDTMSNLTKKNNYMLINIMVFGNVWIV